MKAFQDCGPLLRTGSQPTYMKLLKSAYGLADARWVGSVAPLDRCIYLLYTPEGALAGHLSCTSTTCSWMAKLDARPTRRRSLTSGDVQPRQVGRELIGTLQWPAMQGFPALSASVSILAADVPLGDELNKTMRFAKSSSGTVLTMRKIFDNYQDMCLIVFSDTSFAVRSDSSSQGGYFLVMTNRGAL